MIVSLLTLLPYLMAAVHYALPVLMEALQLLYLVLWQMLTLLPVPMVAVHYALPVLMGALELESQSLLMLLMCLSKIITVPEIMTEVRVEWRAMGSCYL